ncbi:hypothetical protein Tco_1373466 [Tanacetum coccineum]
MDLSNSTWTYKALVDAPPEDEPVGLDMDAQWLLMMEGRKVKIRRLRQEEVKIQALENYEKRRAEMEAKRMDVVICTY